MFSHSPFFGRPEAYYPPHGYENNYDYYGGYQNPYARAQAQEQQRRNQILALERQRELERRRLAAEEMAQRQQRASQYLPEAATMHPARNQSYIPERASQYLPDEFDVYGSYGAGSDDRDAHDYGFGHARGWPAAPIPMQGNRIPQPRQFGQQQSRKQSRSRSRVREKVPSAEPQQASTSQPHEHATDTEPPTFPQPQHFQPSSSSQHSFPSTSVSQQRHPSRSHSREEMEEAATKIQTTYRAHRALKTIETLSNKFRDLKSKFRAPSALDFQILSPAKHLSIPLHNITSSQSLATLSASKVDISTIERISHPKLAYTPANAPLHGYVESLNRLLTSLDGVESYGEKKVRERRKQVVKEVEAEAARIEEMWKHAWTIWTTALKNGAAIGEEEDEGFVSASEER